MVRAKPTKKPTTNIVQQNIVDSNQINLKLKETDFKYLKAFATWENKDINELVYDAIKTYLSSKKDAIVDVVVSTSKK